MHPYSSTCRTDMDVLISATGRPHFYKSFNNFGTSGQTFLLSYVTRIATVHRNISRSSSLEQYAVLPFLPASFFIKNLFVFYIHKIQRERKKELLKMLHSLHRTIIHCSCVLKCSSQIRHSVLLCPVCICQCTIFTITHCNGFCFSRKLLLTWAVKK